MTAAAQWLDDSDGLADWPTAPQSGEYAEGELLESYARCLCYCRVSDRHCRLFLVRCYPSTPTHATADAKLSLRRTGSRSTKRRKSTTTMSETMAMVATMARCWRTSCWRLRWSSAIRRPRSTTDWPTCSSRA